MTFRILVADDEKNIRSGLAKSLEMDGYEVVQAEDGQEALRQMHKTEIDLILADLRMPKLPGDKLLKKVVSAYPAIPVIILTGHGTVDNAVEAMRDGAYDFVTKPVNLERLGLLVKRALSRRELARKHQELEAEISRLGKQKLGAEILGKSTIMHHVFELLKQVAPTKASVLITGESGTGKELVANAIHDQSPRNKAPLVKVHCAALSESLLETELFGHEKGAFTGAVNQRRGRFELADRGTIFLDEIGEINQSTQIKILRVLQEKSFERVGGESTISVDVRIIAATNRNLKEEVVAGRFREDLYYRLNVVNIHIPPLRERPEDIPLLAARFLKEFASENKREILGLEPKAAMALRSYSWPGNVRELRNIIESAVVMSKYSYLGPDDLPNYVTSRGNENDIRIKPGTPMTESEKLIIRANLNMFGGNKSRTSEALGIGRKTLHRKIKEYGLEAELDESSVSP
ncbi:Two-component system response regulator protein [Olavius algarvensis spirochete endosymbiont]|uniref:sigma-54-dependent transcriptional regulator n=1 Tax=Olavius algarvensis spirochete endosymbiont TaxID=260710 RepID=UPI000F143CB6|nr:sigma-54 dependent transcriptional regulator [Olavius algarvensis spirochete endosymbiont]VDA99141.1 Two-component system response regulator protein [Olavius algarvensis spirochete endosymbiont]